MECQPTGLFRDETWFLPLASLNLQKTPPQSHRSMLILSANKTLQCFSRETFYCPFSHPIPAHRRPDSAIPTPLSFLRSVFLAKGHNTWAQSWKKKKKLFKFIHSSGHTVRFKPWGIFSIQYRRFSRTQNERPLIFTLWKAIWVCLIFAWPITIYHIYLSI